VRALQVFLLAIGVVLLGGVTSLAARGRWTTRLGAGGVCLGSGLGLAVALGAIRAGGEASLQLPWNLPYGSFAIRLDPLSGFFLLPVFALAAVTALYGSSYMPAHAGRRGLGSHWFFFSVMVAGMALLVAARDGLLFLIAWEIMSLATFFLVTFDDDRASVRAAGWTYLVAGRIGIALLLPLFVLLAARTGSFDFEAWRQSVPLAGPGSGVLFGLAVLGFGIKAGFFPLHVWLPEAHPAAPSHVSAFMSGAVIKMGIYGLLRFLPLLGAPQPWWGPLLIGIGLASALVGILFAVAQHDLKRLLAYSSVENIGIVTLGMGIGWLGVQYGSATLAALGFGGALLHVLNHAAFKGLLFLAAGSVLHTVRSVDLHELGGLLKRMPQTGIVFAIGAVAICGLPPLNGFASELLIYLAAISGGVSASSGAMLATSGAVAGLALVGGLSAACFAKAFGMAFLGEPRRAGAEAASLIHEDAALAATASTAAPHDPAPAMRAALWLLACACVGLGLGAWLVAQALVPVIASVAGMRSEAVHEALAPSVGALRLTSVAAVVLLVLALLLVAFRRAVLAGRSVRAGVTWDCGYARPTARMQYTAASFAQPITSTMQGLLRTRERLAAPEGLFPRAASLDSHTPDAPRKYLFEPLFAHIAAGLARFRWLQHGNLHIYVLYIAVTLVVLLLWRV